MPLPECKIILITESGEVAIDTANDSWITAEIRENISRKISTIVSDYYSQALEEYLKLTDEIKKVR